MQYLISFLEGMITFISPCILPMLPVYISYFAGGGNNRKRTVANALGFVLGFTIVFVCMGAFAAAVGGLLKRHQTAVNLVTGAVVVLFGLNFAGWLRLPFLNRTRKVQTEVSPGGFGSAVLFGIVFSIGWTPCVGAFLGSALMLASQRGTMLEGVGMLVLYSAGLGIPFVISALLIDKLKETFQVIKQHYRTINLVSGLFLILVGVLMMTGTFGRLLALLAL